ncbi:MAG: WD40 repeat domain-containing protein [Mariprofundaceae bacterium]|nr:WD40 repeat domain-containing protein [Mariprofundaceae bacterium]
MITIEHNNSISLVTFTPDSQTLVTSSFDGATVLWDCNTGKEQKRHATSDHFHHARFSPDGKNILLWSVAYRTALLSDFETFDSQCYFRHFGRLGAVNSAAFSQDGKRVLTASGDGSAVIWSTKDESKLQTFKPETFGGLEVAVFSPDEKQVFTINGNKEACMWDALSGKPLYCITHTKQLWQASVSRDWQHMLANCGDEAVMWSTHSGERVGAFKYQGLDKINQAVFSPDSKWVATCSSYDAEATIWERDSGEKRCVLPHDPQESLCPSAPTFCANSSLVLLLSKPNMLSLHDLSGGQTHAQFEHNGKIDQFGFSSDERMVWARCNEHNKVSIWPL